MSAAVTYACGERTTDALGQCWRSTRTRYHRCMKPDDHDEGEHGCSCGFTWRCEDG